MSRHLKTRVISRLDAIIDHYVPSPAVSTPPARRNVKAIKNFKTRRASTHTALKVVR